MTLKILKNTATTKTGKYAGRQKHTQVQRHVERQADTQADGQTDSCQLDRQMY